MEEKGMPDPELLREFREGVKWLEAGQWGQAAAIYGRMVVRWPHIPELQNNLGAALKNQGKLPEAIAAFEAALALQPGFHAAWNNLGDALRLTNQIGRAFDAYHRALALKRDFPDAWINLGILLRQTRQPEPAVEAYRRALAIQPNSAIALNNIAAALMDTGQVDEALTCLDHGVTVHPNHFELQRSRLGLLQYHPRFDAAAIFREARQWNERFAGPLRGEIQAHHHDASPQRRLRVGYVCADFRFHCMALFLSALLPNHDHGGFEIYCYSSVEAPDTVTARLRSHADVWRDIAPLNDGQAAQLIRQDKIDILVDCTLHLLGCRLLLFARKPAPVQVTWLGYPGTTGMDAIDYRLTDPRLDPAADSNESEIGNPNSDPGAPGSDFGFPISDFSTKEAHYSERTVRLPDTFWCYDPRGMEEKLETEMPQPGPLPALAAGYVTFGCLNNFCKVNPPTLALWAAVMAALPSSRLILLAPTGPPRERILKGLGISDGNRVEFVPLQQRRPYLETYRRIDLCLDTIPANGHTTTLDAFWMGVPVVTRVGRTISGRAGLSQLHHLGLTELAARTDEQFVQLAVDWAGDIGRLDRLRATLRQRMERSPLMDGPRFARNMEKAYRQMWQAWCREVSAAPRLAGSTRGPST